MYKICCNPRYGCEAHGPQPREHKIQCDNCGEPTAALNRICDACFDTYGLLTHGPEYQFVRSLTLALGTAIGAIGEWAPEDLTDLALIEETALTLAVRRLARIYHSTGL